MRQLGTYVTVLVVTTGAAYATPPWSEYGSAVPLRPVQQLVEASCELSVELRGAIAEVWMRQRLTNPGAGALAATSDFELPPNAQLVGMSLQRGRGKSEAALPIATYNGATEVVASPQVLGADPAVITSLGPAESGRMQYRVILQPLESEQEVTLETRWTAVTDIRDGSLALLIPGRGDGAPRCRGLVHVQTGPGASVERLRLDQTELGLRSTATFEVGGSDATLSAVLAFKRPDPLVWLQTMPLADGYTAQATTVLTPAQRSNDSRRALLVIDGSRSMELVGRHNVQRLVRAIGSALPKKAEVEAIVFDRAPTRVLGAWKPATAENLTAIETAVAKHTATNGSDTAGAYAFARKLIGDVRGQTMVIVITDGVLGDLAPDALTKALAAGPNDLDIYTIALAPGRMHAPDAIALRAPVHYFGGSYVEVSTKALDTALASIDDWLRPAWQELALAGSGAGANLPDQLRAGTGAVILEIVKGPGKVKLTGHGDRKISITATKGPKAQLAQLALVEPGAYDESTRARLRERFTPVDELHPFMVLASTGSVAANRRAMIVGGGPITRMVDVEDPRFAQRAQTTPPVVIGGSAVDRNTVTLLLRQYLQPAAFTCYQRALGLNGALAGTARFRLEIGRGELTRAEVVGVGDAAFDACLLDAAYQVTPPLPNPDFNTDDRTIVNYPLTFSVREQKPFVVAGDADSASPIDIDAVQGGVPVSARRAGQVKAGDTSTPLGGLRPTPTK